MNKKMLGHKIKRIREVKNITQKKMANLLGMSISGYNKIERDYVSISNMRLEQIAAIFTMTPSEILSFEESKVTILTDQSLIEQAKNIVKNSKDSLESNYILKSYQNQISELKNELEELRKNLKN